MKQAYKWQLQAVERFKDAAYSAINSSCGTGKSLVAMLIAIAKGMPTIVIVPSHSLAAQWGEDIKAEIPDADVWVYSRPIEAKNETSYQRRFTEWLTQ